MKTVKIYKDVLPPLFLYFEGQIHLYPSVYLIFTFLCYSFIETISNIDLYILLRNMRLF